jgi:hypothetical protein
VFLNQFGLHRLLHRQIGGLFALENPARIDADKAIRIDKVGAVTHQAASRGVLAKWIAGGNCMPCHQRDELLAAGDEECIGGDEGVSLRCEKPERRMTAPGLGCVKTPKSRKRGE